MGVSLQEGINAIPAKFKNSHLLFSIGTKEYAIHIPNVKTLEFERQCNMFRGVNIFAYLAGNGYSIVLRYDGTGSVFTTRDKVLCMNFKYNACSFKEYYCVNGGSYFDYKTNNHTLLNLFTNGKGQYLLTAPNVPISLTFEKGQNKEYLNSLRKYTDATFPELAIQEDVLCVISPTNEIVCTLEGELVKTQSFILL